MNPLSDIKQTPSLHDFERGVLNVHAYLDDHPMLWVAMIAFLVVLVFLNAWSHWRNR